MIEHAKKFIGKYVFFDTAHLFRINESFYHFIVGMKVQTKFLSTSLLSISDKCRHMFSLDTRHHDEGKQLIITLDDKNFPTIDIIHFSKTREKW